MKVIEIFNENQQRNPIQDAFGLNSELSTDAAYRLGIFDFNRWNRQGMVDMIKMYQSYNPFDVRSKDPHEQQCAQSWIKGVEDAMTEERKYQGE